MFLNRLQNTLKIVEYVIVPETQHDETRRLEKLRSSRIPVGSFHMLTSIDFNDDTAIKTNEIEDVVAKWMLATELAVFELTALETSPKCAFRFGR